MASRENPMPLEEFLTTLDLSPQEAEPLLRDAGLAVSKQQLSVSELERLDVAVGKWSIRLAGRDWRRADGADRLECGPETMGAFDLFHRKTGRRQELKTFGELLRWSEAEYGWRP